MIEDKEILLQFESNRREGIKMLFDKYYQALVLYADHYIVNVPVAEDIVQEFLTRLWEERYLGNVTDATLKSYLFVSVRNACYTYCHKKDILRDTLDIAEIDVLEDAAAGLNQQIVNRVMSVIVQLPRQTRFVLESILINDKKYKEVSEELNVSVNTVKTLLKGGMRTLRDKFKDDDLLLLFFIKKRLKPVLIISKL